MKRVNLDPAQHVNVGDVPLQAVALKSELSPSASDVAASSSSWSSSGLSLSVSAHQSWRALVRQRRFVGVVSSRFQYVDDVLRHCLVVEVAELFLGLRRRASPTSAGLFSLPYVSQRRLRGLTVRREKLSSSRGDEQPPAEVGLCRVHRGL